MLMFLQRISKFLFNISALPLLLMMVLTTVDVVARYVFNAPLRDSVELNGMLLSAVIAFSLAHTLIEKSHVSTTLIMEKITGPIKNIIENLVSLANSIVLLLITYGAFNQALTSLSISEHLGSMKIPVYPSKFLFAFGWLIATIATVVFLIRANINTNNTNS